MLSGIICDAAHCTVSSIEKMKERFLPKSGTYQVYFLPLLCQNWLHPKNKYYHTQRSPAIDQSQIVPVFGLKLARYFWVFVLCLVLIPGSSFQLFLPDFQPITEALRTLFILCVRGLSSLGRYSHV